MSASWATEQPVMPRLPLRVQHTLRHLLPSHMLIYINPLVVSAPTLNGPLGIVEIITSSSTTTMSAPLKPAAVPPHTKLLLSSPSPLVLSPGAGRTRSSWLPAFRGSTVVAIPTIDTRVRSIRTATVVTATSTSVPVRRCWRSPQGSNSQSRNLKSA